MRYLKQREVQLALLIVLLVLLVGLRSPVFLTLGSLSSLLTDSTLLIMLALTQMFVIITRGIDLSVASNLALSGMLSALLAVHHPQLPLALVILAALGIGLLLGLLNGYLIGYLDLPPIVVTLGTMSVYRGLVFVLSGGAWVSSHQMPAAFIDFPLTRLLGVTHLVWIAAAAIVLTCYLARYTRFGRDLYAIGNQPQAARYVGIATARRLLWTYGLSGLMAGLCGYLWVARYAVAYSEIAYGFEFTVIAACVIGGISIAGGAGTVGGAVLGSLFLAVINNALPIVKVSPFWQSALTGIVILTAVLLNARGNKNTGRQILPLARLTPTTHRSAT
ncbi:Autoinducer 2 import system permease protein LsrC [Janthinobacterium sp. KBS0711]|uniref:ABC transporter permease n=1 Tax=unclassified Janthinobacterium TaxID=2610881 RepID=UPI0006276C1B|nr:MULTISPECIES: ABC transporter permease [unclassified Janthinobacterium]KKO65844.1 Autoinducer 2 import system permease protein LsrC [Janthinobacterium sp. KBS0711]PJJ20486.1 rhamnose ABC transporter membrane protein [Janthinobacterium sp. 67]TSD69750.1 ABC transporter permease [Janthinobacterium sp. KBS0711]